VQLNAKGYGLNEEGRTYAKKRLREPIVKSVDYIREWIKSNVVGGDGWDKEQNRDFAMWLAKMGFPRTSECLMISSDMCK